VTEKFVLVFTFGPWEAPEGKARDSLDSADSSRNPTPKLTKP